MSVSFFFEVVLPAVGAACVLVTFLMAEWHHIAGFLAEAWRRVRRGGGADGLREAWAAGEAARRSCYGLDRCRLDDGSADRHAWVGGWHEADAALARARSADMEASLAKAIERRDVEIKCSKYWFGEFKKLEGRLKAAEKEASSLKESIESELPALRAELEAARAELAAAERMAGSAREAALREREECLRVIREYSSSCSGYADGQDKDPHLGSLVAEVYRCKAAACEWVVSAIERRPKGV